MEAQMTSDKARTNKKWTSTDQYRSEYERIFGFMVGQSVVVNTPEGEVRGFIAKKGNIYKIKIDNGNYIEASAENIRSAE